MTRIQKLITGCLFILLLTGLNTHVAATHISKPVLTDPKMHYTVGEKVVINGWVDYNAKPTADVLLNFEVTTDKGILVNEESFPSDNQGLFRFELNTHNLLPGTYTITVTSHCLETHRNICSYNSEALTFDLNNP